MKRATRARRDEWVRRVARWRASGLRAEEFARQIGVREATLRWWSWHLDSERRDGGTTSLTAPVTFVEVTSVVQSKPLEVVMPRGIRIRVPMDFDASAMDRLLEVLERRR